MLYDGKDLRHQLFDEKVSKSTSYVQLYTLVPIKDGAKYHSLCVYLQCQEWQGSHLRNPKEWGWCLVDKEYVPYQTDMPVAPQYLLEILRCYCKNNCNTSRCSCKKYGLKGLDMCGFKGTSCKN